MPTQFHCLVCCGPLPAAFLCNTAAFQFISVSTISCCVLWPGAI